MKQTLFETFQVRSPEVLDRLLEHLQLTGIAIFVAVVLGVPMGALALRSPSAKSFLLGATSVLQTIPSLALLTILLPLLGIGATPAIIALILYALLPIVRNTYTGLSGTPAPMLEMADALGLTRGQRLWMIESRFAAPFIMAGIRTATTVGIGIATLSAFVGAGGLGVFINRGLSLNNMNLVMLGAIPAGLLALYADWLLGVFERGFEPGRKRGIWGQASAAVAVGSVAIGGLWVTANNHHLTSSRVASGGKIVVGSKNFTEQLVLGEILAQALENGTNLKVERRLNLAGTAVCHEAMLKGDVDMYVEYNGTALLSVLKQSPSTDPTKVWEAVRTGYEKLNLEWLPPLGFANTYALAVRKADAEKNRWTTVSDLKATAAGLKAGFTSEFLERQDGYPGLAKRYGYRFGKAVEMEPSLMYEAVKDRQVDVISAFSTDGRIAAFDLALMADNRHFFPPYDAAIVARKATLQDHPEVAEVLGKLSGKLTEPVMQQLNLAVDRDKRSPKEVAHDFLEGLKDAPG